MFSQEERAAKAHFCHYSQTQQLVCPREAELMSKKMPFPCSHFSAQNSLFMLRVQFCENPYWGQHNLLIIEVRGKFCFSGNWQIKPIRQFLKKKKPIVHYAFILNIRIQQISREQPLCKTLIFWEWIGTVIAKLNILLLYCIPSLQMSAFTSKINGGYICMWLLLILSLVSRWLFLMFSTNPLSTVAHHNLQHEEMD